MKHHIYLALRAAVASRRIGNLQQLLTEHGVLAFTEALLNCSPRVAADALSLISASERTSILRHLPQSAREKLRPMGFQLEQNITNPCRVPTHQLRRQFA